MNSVMVALIVKPLVYMAVFLLILKPARKLTERLPDSRIKRLLLLRVK